MQKECHRLKQESTVPTPASSESSRVAGNRRWGYSTLNVEPIFIVKPVFGYIQCCRRILTSSGPTSWQTTLHARTPAHSSRATTNVMQTLKRACALWTGSENCVVREALLKRQNEKLELIVPMFGGIWDWGDKSANSSGCEQLHISQAICKLLCGCDMATCSDLI